MNEILKKKPNILKNGSLIKKTYTFNIVNDILEKSIKALVIRLKNVLH